MPVAERPVLNDYSLEWPQSHEFLFEGVLTQASASKKTCSLNTAEKADAFRGMKLLYVDEVNIL